VLFSGSRLKKVVFSLLLVSLAFFLYTRHRAIEERGSLRWYDRPLVLITAPVARGVLLAREGVRTLFKRYFFLIGVEKENERLRRDLEGYKTREILRQEVENEAGRLRELLDLKKETEGEWIAARVVSYPPVGPYRILTINKGEKAGIRRRAPVISSDGLVGQVSRVMGDVSQVLLVTDPTSAVDARLEGTDARGLIVGKGMKLGLKRELFIGAFEYLNQAIEVEEGAAVVTSGLDGVFPPGLRIGRIHGRKKNKFDVFQQAEVIPAVEFHKLKEVLVLRQP
jgi:rod shape-determining protein MreC